MINHPTTAIEGQGARPSSTSFWAYPRMRSFGLDHYQAVDVLTKDVLPDEIHSQNVEWIQKFHNKLKTLAQNENMFTLLKDIINKDTL